MDTSKATSIKNEKDIQVGKPAVLDNLLSSMKFVLHGMGMLRINLSNKKNKAHARAILSCECCIGEDMELLPFVAHSFCSLWGDLGIRAAVARGHEFQLNDSALYFFENMSRIIAPNYIPTKTDVLRVRVRTHGVTETQKERNGTVVSTMSRQCCLWWLLVGMIKTLMKTIPRHYRRMKCLQCSHVSLEKAPNFCSWCGCKMSSQLNETAADKSQDRSQTSSNIPHSTDAEMNDISCESEALDYQIASVSPKRPNEDINSNPQKKKNHSSSGDSMLKVEHSEKQQSAHANQMNPESKEVNESGNTETKKDNQKKNQNEEPQKSSQEMVFGPKSKLKKNQDFSRDAAVKAKQSQKQQSLHDNEDSTADQKRNESDNTKNQCEVPPKRSLASAQHISSSDRLTIYFHAVLSKDFKFNLEEDLIFIRAGGCLGDWEKNLVELSVSRDLGEHGFLVEGKFICKKTSAEAVSIPYKYVVYKAKKQTYEYEYIYKLDSNETTNRCLFVKTHLLNDEGEWHQYDDIICVEPSKNMLKRLKDAFWPDQRKDVIQGREIAGRVMLETIFDLLRNWGKINLNSFFNQLGQFYEVYGNPFVFEKTEMKWYSLQYDKKDVSKLLKQFMLQHVTPELQKDSKERSTFIKEPLKAALIMLLSEMVEALILRVRAANMIKWIIIIPLLHFLRGTSKPFEPVFIKVNPQSEQSWAGLQGLKSSNVTSPGSQDKSCPNEDYGIQCIQATCKLLEKICKRIHYYTYAQNFTDIPVACMNLVASISGFAQVTQQADTFPEKTLVLLNEAKKTMRTWIRQTFKGRLLDHSFMSAVSFTTEIEMWNNIIAIDFMSKDFTKEWKETFTLDFEGKYQQEDHLDQIEVYCSKIEKLNGSQPYLVDSVEKCALQAVTTVCQVLMKN
ncbi:E3 ubiquitin-protein ligase RNF213-alpha-like protein [Labeo rohita]|uniref:E3 ubiquitin-protein ligase RNF213-alpha-like protein n=1 Tax=Labeo rohita TaxID=84645 RepID=A0A498NC98_LABRO|nr:E3 ubiquitin-protein ligase RNF213-alpha-like protein [Labeo rohita]